MCMEFQHPNKMLNLLEFIQLPLLIGGQTPRFIGFQQQVNAGLCRVGRTKSQKSERTPENDTLPGKWVVLQLP